MAENFDDGEFWLPSQFLTDDDILMDMKTSKNTGLGFGFGYGKESDGGGVGGFFPHEWGHGFGGSFGFSSDLSSPVESVVGSTETESDEEDYLAGLTRQMARSTLEDDLRKPNSGFFSDNTKSWVMSGSPQSTLCAAGSGCGCRQGSSRGSPNGVSRVSSPPATTWDLLYAAAGEVARMRANEEGYGFNHSRGVFAPPRKPSPVSVPVKNPNPDVGFYSNNHSLSHLHLQATQFQQMKQQQQMMKQHGHAVWGGQANKMPAQYQQNQAYSVVQSRARNGDVISNRSNLTLGLSPSAWPPLQHQQQQQQQQQKQQNGTGMRAVFLGTSGSKRECAGTGVFLPRRVGYPPETRKKPACSTVLLPARVVQALNLNLDEIGGAQPHLQPRFNGSLALDTDVALRLRGSSNSVQMCQQKRNFGSQPVTNHEIRLPPDWTY